MAKVSKVVKSNGDVIMDISQDNVNANNLLQGGTAHGSDGEAVQGAVITHNVIDNLTSDSTTDALSAKQGKVLKGLVDDKVSKSGDTMTGDLTFNVTATGGGYKNAGIKSSTANSQVSVSDNRAVLLAGTELGSYASVTARNAPAGQAVTIEAHNDTSDDYTALEVAQDGVYYNDEEVATTADLNSYLPLTNNAGFHNGIYRGKYLGSSFTSAQKSAIANGTFDDLYVGDYWKINGVNWRIADINYYLHTGDTETTTPHLVIVPDSVLGTSYMNPTTSVSGAYVGSHMYTTTLKQDGTEASNSIFGKIKAAFGESNLLSIRQRFTNAADGSTGYASGVAWYNTRCFLLSQCMVYGNAAWGDGNYSNGFNVGIDKTQLALFALAPSFINTNPRTWYWLRDVHNHFSTVRTEGYAFRDGASNSFGVRPVFLLKGA